MKADPVPSSDEQLLAVLAMLEECRSALSASGNRDSAHLVSVAALDVRMKLNRIGDADLKLLCEAMAAKEDAEDAAREASSSSETRSLSETRSSSEARSSPEGKSSSGFRPSYEDEPPQAEPRRPLLRVVK
jgi:hypothetical protein